MRDLSQMVRELRRKTGWTQEDFAEVIGVSLSTVQRWERIGGRPVRLARGELQKIFYKVGIDENITAENKQEPRNELAGYNNQNISDNRNLTIN